MTNLSDTRQCGNGTDGHVQPTRESEAPLAPQRGTAVTAAGEVPHMPAATASIAERFPDLLLRSEAFADLRSGMTTVAVGGFDQIAAAGLTLILDGGTNAVFAAERLPPDRRPDVLLLADAILHTAAPLAGLRARHPNARLLIITPRPSTAYGRLSLACGASCIPASAPVAAIRYSVNLTAAGRPLFIASDGSILRAAAPDAPPPLTGRESEVLALLIGGLPYASIAHRLKLQADTVKKHGARIREKLAVKRSQDLVGLPLAVLSDTHPNGWAYDPPRASPNRPR